MANKAGTKLPSREDSGMPLTDQGHHPRKPNSPFQRGAVLLLPVMLCSLVTSCECIRSERSHLRQRPWRHLCLSQGLLKVGRTSGNGTALGASCGRPLLYARHLLFHFCGGTEHRWGAEEFLVERTSVSLLVSLLQTQIHLLPLKQPGQGCVVCLEARSCFWSMGGALHRLSPFSAML